MVRNGLHLAAAAFAGGLEPAAFHVGPAQDEALARLEWLVAERQRCGLVVSASGLGKSHLAAVAARRLGGLGAEVAILSLRGLPEGDWLELLLERLPLDPASRGEPIRPWIKLENRLRENTLLERPTVLVFDDVDLGPADAREGIARLAAAAEPRFAGAVVVATATPDGLACVPDAIRQRAAVRIDLSPWDEADVVAAITHALGRAGAPADAFSPPALATIARFSGGLPRTINQLARLAATAAATEELPQVDAATVERVWRELLPGEPLTAAAPVTADTLPQPRVRSVRRLFG
jgi:hypothetical protein